MRRIYLEPHFLQLHHLLPCISPHRRYIKPSVYRIEDKPRGAMRALSPYQGMKTRLAGLFGAPSFFNAALGDAEVVFLVVLSSS